MGTKTYALLTSMSSFPPVSSETLSRTLLMLSILVTSSSRHSMPNSFNSDIEESLRAVANTRRPGGISLRELDISIRVIALPTFHMVFWNFAVSVLNVLNKERKNPSRDGSQFPLRCNYSSRQTKRVSSADIIARSPPCYEHWFLVHWGVILRGETEGFMAIIGSLLRLS